MWAAEVSAATAAAGGPEAKVEAYVRKQLELVGDPRHRALVAISVTELDAGAREKIRAAHGGLVAMVVEALGELGCQGKPRLAAMLLQGVVDEAVRRIELGTAEEPGDVAEAAVRMVLREVRGMSLVGAGAGWGASPLAGCLPEALRPGGTPLAAV